MNKYWCPNVVAQKKMGSNQAGEPFTVEIEGDKATFYVNGVKRHEDTKAFFEDNFFAIVGPREKQ
jgi:hypothetical protein